MRAASGLRNTRRHPISAKLALLLAAVLLLTGLLTATLLATLTAALAAAASDFVDELRDKLLLPRENFLDELSTAAATLAATA